MPSTIANTFSTNATYSALPYYNMCMDDLVKFVSTKAKVEIIECKYEPERVIKNGPAMVVFWKDGTKTIVKRKKGEPDNIYHAFTAALAKKIFGSNSKVNSIAGSVIDERKKSKKIAKNIK